MLTLQPSWVVVDRVLVRRRRSIEHAGQVNFTRGKLNFVHQPCLVDYATEPGTINIVAKKCGGPTSYCSVLEFSLMEFTQSGGCTKRACVISWLAAHAVLF